MYYVTEITDDVLRDSSFSLVFEGVCWTFTVVPQQACPCKPGGRCSAVGRTIAARL